MAVNKLELERSEKAVIVARDSALLAHTCWALLIKSKEALMASMSQHGIPYSEVVKWFNSLMDDHSIKYKAALDHLDQAEKVIKSLRLDNG